MNNSGRLITIESLSSTEASLTLRFLIISSTADTGSESVIQRGSKILNGTNKTTSNNNNNNNDNN